MIVERGTPAIVVALLVSAVLLGVGLMSFHAEVPATKPVVLPFDTFWCASDDDCALVERIGCCPCSEGGAQGAVTKWHVNELRRFLKQACRPRAVCIQLDLCRHDVKAVCDRHTCRVGPLSLRTEDPGLAQPDQALSPFIPEGSR